MDSRQLYKAAEYLSSIISWDLEWIHFGTGQNVKFELITKLIEDFLIDDSLHLVLKRGNSGSHSKNEVYQILPALLGREEFQLWNNSMNRVIQFDAIGVLNLGKKE